MTELARAEVVLDARDQEFLRGMRRSGTAAVTFGNVAAVAIQKATAAVADLGRFSIRSAVQLEGLQRGLQVTAGGAEQASRQMRQLERIARLPGLGFAEAIRGANQLNIAFSDLPDTLNLTNRTLQAFGNAIALTGGGRAELDRVVTQVTQIASAGKILTQDLRPIIQTAPAVGQALKNAFGTINAADIEALGLSTEEFFARLLTGLEGLETAPRTAATSLEDLSDAAFRAGAALGDIFLPSLVAGADAFATALDSAASSMRDLRDEQERLSQLTPSQVFTAFGTGGINYGGKQPGITSQFLPGRSQRPGEDALANAQGTKDDIAAQAEALGKLAEKTRAAGMETLRMNEEIAFLNSMIKELPEPTLFYVQNLDRAVHTTSDLVHQTAAIGMEFDQEAFKAKSLQIRIEALALAHDRLSSAQKNMLGVLAKLGPALGVLGGLSGFLGVGLPGLSNVGRLVGALGSFTGFFAEGGNIPSGGWGIVGERGPEIVRGPAHVTPSGGMPAINVPPARDLITLARDQQWVRAIIEAFRTAEDGGFRAATT